MTPDIPSCLTPRMVNQAAHDLLREGKLRVKPGCEEQLRKLIGDTPPDEAEEELTQFVSKLYEEDSGDGEFPGDIGDVVNYIADLKSGGRDGREISRLRRLINGTPEE